MEKPNDERRITIFIWVACGVTFLVIFALWFLALPWQFELIERQSQKEQRRWETVPTTSPTNLIPNP
jgi:heme exporter protein D